MSRPGFQTAAWSWADHLRAGGTTPWLEWLRMQPAEPDPVDGTPRGAVPGAAQLELVRRLALRLPPGGSGPAFGALADLALGRSGPGRGPARLPLLWPDDDRPRRVGAPPTDPATVPADELARVGVGLLAELLGRRSPETDAALAADSPRTRRRLGGKGFHLAGAPVTTAQVRGALAAAGHVEGGRRPEVVLLAEPLDVLLAQIWSTRVQRGAPVRWVTFAGRWARRDQLPPSADLAAIAAFWSGRVGPERVHVVAGPDARRTSAEILGLRTADAPATDPRSLSPAGVDVLRRLNRVLNVRFPADVRSAHLRHVASLLPEHPAPALDVPHRHRAWLDERAGRVAADLRAGGYAVHGDLAGLAPRHGGAPHPRRDDVLALVLDTCLRAAELET